VVKKGEVMAALDDVLERLRRLEDERAILHLSEAYSNAIDTEAVEDWLALFTDDGRFAWRPGSGDPRGPAAEGGWKLDLRGQDELRRWAEDGGMQPLGRENHVSRPPLIGSIDGDVAESVTWYVILRWQQQRIDVISTGRYVDRIVRGADGAWRFQERLAEGVFPSGLE
jgi:3-phenylpropionate/cinnamic acid dioxygenase small subunit